MQAFLVIEWFTYLKKSLKKIELNKKDYEHQNIEVQYMLTQMTGAYSEN